MKSLRSSMCGLVLAATAQFAVASPQLVINGNFETGNFAGWSQSGFTSEQTISALNLGGMPGTGLVFSDGAYGSNGYLSQSIATDAGTVYTLQFDLKRWDRGERQAGEFITNYAEVMFGGATVFSETDTSSDWMHFSFDTLAGIGGAQTLRIGSRDEYDYVQWDNFSLTAKEVTVDPPDDNQVPEPASIAMLLLGLGVLGFTRRKTA